MKIPLIVVLISLLWVLPANANCDPSHLALALSLMETDRQQTLAFRARGVTEINPLLGPTPSEHQINAFVFFNTSLATTYACHDWPLSDWILPIWTLGETVAVLYNLAQQHAISFTFGVAF